MSYQNILEALNQELACVNRAIGFLTKATGSDLASTNGVFHHALAQPPSEDRDAEMQIRGAAQTRAARRLGMVAELREEQMLLMSALESIHRLAERLED